MVDVKPGSGLQVPTVAPHICIYYFETEILEAGFLMEVQLTISSQISILQR